MMKKGFRTKKQSLRACLINAVVLLLLFFILEYAVGAKLLNRYYQGILMTVFINIILVTSLNLTTGFLGQIALGHAGFMSIGAYSAALFIKSVQNGGVVLIENGTVTGEGMLYFLLSLLLGGCLAAVSGLIVGIPALRLKGDYLAIITLGFGEIIRVVIENIPSVTGGAQGLKGIPKTARLDVVFVIMVICVTLMFTFVRSRHGRALTAIREDDIASEASGINNTYYKVLAFTVAAFFAGIAGGIYAQYLSVLGASNFGFMKSVDILVMVVLGGMGSLTGSIISAVALTELPELLRTFADYRMLIYSVVLIVVMIFKPSGLLGRYEFSLTRCIDSIAARLRGNKQQPETPAEQSPEGGAEQ